MLTKDDLEQIRKVIRNEVNAEVKDSTRTLDGQIRISRMQIQQNISELDDRMKNVEIRLDSVQKDVSGLKKDLSDVKKRVKKIEKTTDIMVKFFGEEDVKFHKRVTKIEQHLGFPKN